MAENRKPPQNIEAEESVLGAMLIKKDAIIEAAEMVSDRDFYREANRVIFSTMQELAEEGEAVDIVTLTDRLKRGDMLDKVGGIAYVTKLANAVPTAANVHYHLKIVKEKAELRRLIDAATEIAGAAYEDS